MKYKLFLLLSLCALTTFADTPYHGMVSYPGIAPGVFVTDAAGNYFIVSSATTPSGAPRIQVDKTDPNGSALASITTVAKSRSFAVA
jgi:hypothetical protein